MTSHGSPAFKECSLTLAANTDDSKTWFQYELDLIDKTDSIWRPKFFANDLEAPESSANSIIDPSIETQSYESSEPLPCAGDDDDYWRLDLLNEDPSHIAPLKSWERYEDRSFQEPISAYFSESGSKGFDAALSQATITRGHGTAGRIAQSDVFIQSLLRLGLGWSSPFFRYNQKTMQFDRQMEDIRVSGVSLPLANTVIDAISRCGMDMQRLRAFAQNFPTKFRDVSALVNLRGTIAVIIYNLEQQIVSQARQTVSILQVVTLFHRCGDLLAALVDLVDAVELAVSDAQVISTVVQKAAFFTQKFDWIENLAQEIMIRVTRPWFEFIESWIGLRTEESALLELLGSGTTFAQIEQYEEPNKFRTGSARIEYKYIEDHMPSLVPSEQAQLMFESGRSLRLLKKAHPLHPLARYDVLNRIGHLRLHCVTTWADIEAIQKKAKEYEMKLRTEILRYNRGVSISTAETEPESQNSALFDGKSIIEKTFELFDIDDRRHVSGTVMDEEIVFADQFNQMLQNVKDLAPGSISNDEGRFGPELTSCLYLSLGPVISGQARLIDFSCLHHLFKEHKLRHHLDLQHRFQLLGDGSFVTRLSHSLFDPEMDSGERKSGKAHGGVHTGLRLGSRDTWPPASSELRLVLIGLLGDCYFSEPEPETAEQTHAQKENEIPGGLSFSIRELTEDEVERCKDPNAIEALDFLRLQYKPSEVLETLITAKSLKRYDRLFKHLLRLLRMVSVVKELIRDSTTRGSLSGDTRNVFQKFRIDAQHFVLAVSDYCFHIGIGHIWSNFQSTLSQIERCIDRGDVDGTIEAAHSVPRLRDLHEDILDQMLFASFLSKRHLQAAKLLDNIFGIVLAFSPLSKAEGLSGLRHENEGTVLHLYSTFRKQVSALVGYLRGLDTGKGSSKSMAKSQGFFSTQTESTSVFEHLRMRLEVKDYYRT